MVRASMSARCQSIRSLSLVLLFAGGAAAGDGAANYCNPSPGATPLVAETASAGFMANQVPRSTGCARAAIHGDQMQDIDRPFFF
jgi:hypothetical protein